jgi:integrase
MATCFADFLRFSEVLNIRFEDITLTRNGLCFCVKKAKNYRLGFDVCLPVDDPKSISAFVLDFLQGGLKWRPGKVGFLCCQLEGGNFRTRLPISYSALHSSCKDLIEAVGLDPTKYLTHSAKRGSATAAVVARARSSLDRTFFVMSMYMLEINPNGTATVAISRVMNLYTGRTSERPGA